MNKAYLLTGGNMDDRKKVLARACEQIAIYAGKIVAASSLYETEAWGKKDQPSFLNQALAIKTVLPAKELLACILQIEKEMGRIREEKYGPRIIDIDILLFNNDIINEQGLKIPHPQMQNRRFALTPLAEIEPDIVHPVFNETISGLLAICPDKLEVKRFPDT